MKNILGLGCICGRLEKPKGGKGYIEEMVSIKEGNGEPWDILDKKIFKIRECA